jgi:hypothetical protein
VRFDRTCDCIARRAAENVRSWSIHQISQTKDGEFHLGGTGRLAAGRNDKPTQVGTQLKADPVVVVAVIASTVPHGFPNGLVRPHLGAFAYIAVVSHDLIGSGVEHDEQTWRAQILKELLEEHIEFLLSRTKFREDHTDFFLEFVLAGYKNTYRKRTYSQPKSQEAKLYMYPRSLRLTKILLY